MTVIQAFFGGARTEAENRALLEAGDDRARRLYPMIKKAERAAYQRGREAAKRQRTPAWANHDAIAAIYIECERLTRETGIPHEVDHIVPLGAQLASGLHCEFNLQILTRAANRQKCNTFEVA